MKTLNYLITSFFLCLLFPLIVFAQCPGNLDDVINTPAFGYEISYTNDNTDPDFFSDARAQNVANSFDPTHQLFINSGFLAPFFNSSPPGVCIYDSSNIGTANFCRITLDSPYLLPMNEPCIRLVAGHELFHHVEYAYINNGSTSCGGCSGTWGQWTCEGTARLMQDKAFNDLDQDAGCITYLDTVNTYLANPNQKLMNASYKAALFWNYLTEQLGTVTTEPGRGVDVIETFWANTDPTSPDSVQVLRDTINDFDPASSLEEIFHDFAIANYTKELDVSSLSDADKYFYVDETPAGGGSTYDQVARANVSFSSTLSSSSVVQWGARYFEVDVDVEQGCDLIGFRGESEDNLGWTLIGIKTPTSPGDPDRVVELHKSVGTSFYKAILNDSDDPYIKLAAVVTGFNDGGNFDYVFARQFLSSGNLDILRPAFTRLAFVGEHDNPDRFQVRLNVTGPNILTPDGTGTISVKGLSLEDFTVYVENASVSEEASILSAAYVGGQYWLTVQAPVMDPADGTLFDVRVCLCESDGECAVSSVSANSVIYSKILRNQMMVIDRSGSMKYPAATPKIDAALAASRIFVDAAADDDLLGVVSFSGDIAECNDDSTLEHDLQTVNGNRMTAKGKIDLISAGGMTSIGDGLNRAQDRINLLGNPAGIDHIVLLSDGMENEEACWQSSPSCSNATCPSGDVKDRFDPGGSASGTVIDAIAFGPQTDQTLMQDIASTTDGDYFYVDVSEVSDLVDISMESVSAAGFISPSSLSIGNRISEVYLSVSEKIQGKERLFFAAGTVSPGSKIIQNVNVENEVVNATFAFNWEDPNAGVDVELYDPSNNLIGSTDASIFKDSTHKVYRFSGPIAGGNWRAEIQAANSTQYIAVLSGNVIKGVQTELYFGQIPGVYRGLFGSRFLAGLPVTILVSLTGQSGIILNADVSALVLNPDGSEIVLPLFDDGSHNDGDANDGIYGNIYTRTAQSSSEGVPEREAGTNPGVNGSYVVNVTARGQSNNGEKFTRLLNRAFQVYEFIYEIDPDRDQDGLPDRWEALYGTELEKYDRDEDYDNDGLANIEEFRLGTHPLDPDTDDGGEMDGSEVKRGANPLDPRDDLLPRPIDVEVVSRVGCEDPRQLLKPNTNVIRYPSHPAYTGLILFRGTTPGSLIRVAEIFPKKTTTPGIYFDEGLRNGQIYYYQLQAVGESGATSGLSPFFSGTPQEDPVPPKGWVTINNGDLTTTDPNVLLSLDDDPDNVGVLISNSPAFNGAKWIPNPGEIKWRLEPDPVTERATVYAKFRDKAGNESDTYNDSIFVDPDGDFDNDGIPDIKDNCPFSSNRDQADADRDGVGDVCDNCTEIVNPDQRDTDSDGYGNICDTDLNNDKITNVLDLGLFKSVFMTSAPNADFNGDGNVNVLDLGILKRNFLQPPGPSGLVQ